MQSDFSKKEDNRKYIYTSIYEISTYDIHIYNELDPIIMEAEKSLCAVSKLESQNIKYCSFCSDPKA